MKEPADFLLERFATARDSVAFIDNDRPYTYGWILDRAITYTGLLAEKGIAPGEIVVVVADYSPDLFCFMLALIGNRNVFAPLTRDSVVEKDVVLELSECPWFVDFVPEIEKLAFTRFDRSPANALFAELRRTDDPGLLLFSSGSTGKPKGILHNFRLVLERFRVQRPRVTAITFLMLDHFGGINTLFHILSNLGTVVTIRNRTVQSICDAIAKHKVELLPTTPSFLNMLARSDVSKEYDLSSLRTISYGTEVMPQSTLERISALFPKAKLQQTYGLSELGVLRSQSEGNGSLWVRLGGEGYQTKVVDDILWIKSNFAMLGYLNAPSPFDAEGWFNTQDRVEVQGDFFRILGRVTDLMNIGGQKVYPSEIEEVIIHLDNVQDVAVYSEKNGLLGHIVVAEIVTKTPEPLDQLKKRVRKECLEKLASFKVPSKVVIAQGNLYSVRQKKVRKATGENPSV